MKKKARKAARPRKPLAVAAQDDLRLKIDKATEHELQVAMQTFGPDNDSALRDRGVYTKEVMEREFTELLPVEVGLRAIQELRDEKQK